jgi:hypothetical protein
MLVLRSFSISINTALFIVCFPLLTVNHSHIDALCHHTSKVLLKKVQINKHAAGTDPAA